MLNCAKQQKLKHATQLQLNVNLETASTVQSGRKLPICLASKQTCYRSGCNYFTKEMLIKRGAILISGLLSLSEMLVLKGSKKRCLSIQWRFSATNNNKGEELRSMTRETEVRVT